jgi:hypothetical protein
MQRKIDIAYEREKERQKEGMCEMIIVKKRVREKTNKNNIACMREREKEKEKPKESMSEMILVKKRMRE